MKPLLSLSLLAVLTTGPLPATPAASCDVWTVDDDAPADFADVQSAVNAASAGDVVLVKAGVYSGFEVAGKGISIVGDAPAPVKVDGLVRLRALPAGELLTLSNLELAQDLRVHQNAGEVRFTDCLMQRSGLCQEQAAQGSHRITDCGSVVLTRTTVVGRQGGSVPWSCDVWDGLVGETALFVSGSRVALYSCTVQGGPGGDGADGSCIFCLDGFPGDGGVGLIAMQGSELYLDDSTVVGGAGAPQPTGCDFENHPSQDGVPYVVSSDSTLQTAADPVLALESPTLVREDDLLPVTVTGPAGASAFVVWSDIHDWRPFGGAIGILHCDSASVHVQAIGSLSSAGPLTATFDPPAIPAGCDSRRLSIQVFAIAPGVGRMLGTPSSLDVLDPAF